MSDELRELEAQMLAAVKRRHDRIAVAQRLIDAANREFDELAAPLGREINARRKAEEPVNDTPRRERKPSHNMEGLTDEEQEHYLRLRAGK